MAHLAIGEVVAVAAELPSPASLPAEAVSGSTTSGGWVLVEAVLRCEMSGQLVMELGVGLMWKGVALGAVGGLAGLRL